MYNKRSKLNKYVSHQKIPKRDIQSDINHLIDDTNNTKNILNNSIGMTESLNCNMSQSIYFYNNQFNAINSCLFWLIEQNEFNKCKINKLEEEICHLKKSQIEEKNRHDYITKIQTDYIKNVNNIIKCNFSSHNTLDTNCCDNPVVNTCHQESNCCDNPVVNICHQDNNCCDNQVFIENCHQDINCCNNQDINCCDNKVNNCYTDQETSSDPLCPLIDQDSCDNAVSTGYVKISVGNINKTISCCCIRNQSNTHIWGSFISSDLIIDNLSGSLVFDDQSFKIKNDTIVFGSLSVFNNVINTQYNSIIINDDSNLKVIFANKPIIPTNIPIDGSIHINIIINNI